VQLLWINLLMDSFAALMLATEPPDPELMFMPPQDKTRALMTVTMNKNIVVHAVYQLALLLGLSLTTSGTSVYGLPDHELGHRIHYSCIFNTFVFLQLFNLFNSRRIHDRERRACARARTIVKARVVRSYLPRLTARPAPSVPSLLSLPQSGTSSTTSKSQSSELAFSPSSWCCRSCSSRSAATPSRPIR